jgi:hypothetical protein
MVFDFGKDPQKQQREEQLRQERLRAQNQANNKPKVPPKKIAQAIPIPRVPVPIPLPKLPEYPWVTPQDIERIQNYMFKGKNPLTGEPIQTQDEQKVFKMLTPAQIKGLKKSKYKEDLRYANDSLTNDKSCAVIGLNIGNGYEPKAMMTTALTGANNASLVVTPAGNTALFDGLYKGKTKADQKRPGGGYAYEVEPIEPPMNTAEEIKAQNFIRSKSAEWERQGTVARECGYTMRVAIPDEDLVRWTNKSLFTHPPSFQVIEAKLGGTHGQVRANTVGGEVHHMPADSVSPLTTAKGPAIWMYILDHEDTASYKLKPGAKDHRDEQRDLINQGDFAKAMALDIQDVKKKFPGVYDISIMQMLKKYLKNQTTGNK